MNVTRTFDIVKHIVNQFPKSDNLAVKRNGKWEEFSAETYNNFVDYFSCALLEAGLKPGDKISSVSGNCPEWNFMDMGMSQIGVVHVPIYPTVSEDVYKHIFTHSESKVLVLSSAEFYGRIAPYAQSVPNITKIITFDKIEGATWFYDFIETGKATYEKNIAKVKEIAATISENDLCTIIYTSGTTGMPKGVMLSHKNFMSNVKACAPLLFIDENDRTLSFLPLCHVLERMVNYLSQYKGSSVYYAESIDTIGDNMREIKPAEFTAVPRVIEKIFDKIITKGRSLKGIKKIIFFWALKVADDYCFTGKGIGYKIKLKIADMLVFKKWRDATGGKIKTIIVGGAALQERLARVFWAAGIKLAEGYGLTETSPVIAVNRDAYPYIKFGTVGPLIETSEVKIAEDGEILFKGPNLMLGYFKEPELTAAAIDSDGWFHTGDIGELDANNILKITDRKKEIFKLSTGKYVAPQVIENKFKESPFIEQIIVVGANEKFTAALIVPNFYYLKGWCHAKNIDYTTDKDIIEHKEIIDRIQREVDELNQGLNKTIQIKKFALVAEAWTPESGELSPTLKLVRRVVKERYKDIFNKIYGYNE